MKQQAEIPAEPMPDKAIEKEFIYNLQQEVYFLELQGRLLREKMTEQKQQKSRGVEANPAFDAELDENLPLTQLFEKLREQFEQETHEHGVQLGAKQKEIDELKEEVGELEQVENEFNVYRENDAIRLQMERANIDKLLKRESDELADVENELAAQNMQNELLTDERARLDKVNEDNSEKLVQSTADIKRLNNELQMLRENTNEELERVMAQEKARIDELEAHISAQQKEMLEVRAQLTQMQGDNAELRQNADLSVIEIRTLQNQVSNLKKELQDTSKQLSASRARSDDLEREKAQMNAKLQVLLKFEANQKEMVELYENKRIIDELNQTIEQLRAEVQTHVDGAKLAHLKELQNEQEITRQTDEIAQLNEKFNEQNERMLTITSENQEIAIKYQAASADVDDKNAQLAEMNEAVSKLTARVAFLDAELQLKSELSQVELEEFENLRKSNEELAELLSSLQARFTNLGTNAEEYNKYAQIEREKKLARAALNDRKK